MAKAPNIFRPWKIFLGLIFLFYIKITLYVLVLSQNIA